jgi:predicted solute-binding protein
LDSLGGTHPTVFKVLRSYLQQELSARKGLEMALTTKEITGKYSSKVHNAGRSFMNMSRCFENHYYANLYSPSFTFHLSFLVPEAGKPLGLWGVFVALC